RPAPRRRPRPPAAAQRRPHSDLVRDQDLPRADRWTTADPDPATSRRPSAAGPRLRAPVGDSAMRRNTPPTVLRISGRPPDLLRPCGSPLGLLRTDPASRP